MNRTFLTVLAVVLVSAAPITSAFAAETAEVSTGRFSNLSVNGYDVVAYFTDGSPVVGSSQFQTEYKGATWRFVSQSNLDMFLAAPDQYAPQYGGYCAWAVSQGYTAPGSPKAWSIVEGKLYLNYNEKIRDDWSQDIPGFISKADANWPNVLN